jgi:hypothetical protein
LFVPKSDIGEKPLGKNTDGLCGILRTAKRPVKCDIGFAFISIS